MHRAINPRPHQLTTQNLSSIFMNSEKFDGAMHPGKRVGFIGLGLMGGGMAMNILKKHRQGHKRLADHVFLKYSSPCHPPSGLDR